MTTAPGANRSTPCLQGWGSLRLNWLTIGGGAIALWMAIASLFPPTVYAYPYRVAVALEREAGESYDTLIRRAEAAARVVAQRSFSRDRGVTDVSITVMGQSGGAIAPLLSLEVNRTQWNSRPDARRWATYFLTARGLLRLDEANSIDPNLPTATASPTSPTPGVPSSPAAIPATTIPEATPGTTISTPTATEPATNQNPVRIDLPAAPAGQLGLPRSILR